MFTNLGLVMYARAMMEYNSPYWFGTYGQEGSEKLYLDRKAVYPDQYNKWSRESFEKQYGKKVHDCSGLIKGYKMNPTLGADGYVKDPMALSKYNSIYDISADLLYKRAREKGAISSIPDIKGIIVWKSGHVGIYVGKDEKGVRWVIEERGHSYGTVLTKLDERPWTNWFKDVDIEYLTEINVEKQYCKPIAEVLRKGDQGLAVKVLQSCLNLQGYSLEVDGHFGNKTLEAVSDFQKKNKIKNVGVVGVATWNKLLKG